VQEFAVIVCSGFDNKGLAGWSLQEEGGNLRIEWQKGSKQGFESYFCQLLFERDSTVMYDGDKKEVEIVLTQEISFSRRGGLKQFTLQSVAEILYLVIL
jgi:hypothetical protein